MFLQEIVLLLGCLLSVELVNLRLLLESQVLQFSQMQVAVLLITAGLLALGLVVNDETGVLVGLAIFFAGFNFLEASMPARLSLLAPIEVRGSAMGVFSTAQFLGAFAGGLLGGILYAAAGPESVLVAAAVLAALWLLSLLARRAA